METYKDAYRKFCFSEPSESSVRELDAAMTLINFASSGGMSMSVAKDKLASHIDSYISIVGNDSTKISIGLVALITNFCDPRTLKPILGMGWAKDVIDIYIANYCPDMLF